MGLTAARMHTGHARAHLERCAARDVDAGQVRFNEVGGGVRRGRRADGARPVHCALGGGRREVAAAKVVPVQAHVAAHHLLALLVLLRAPPTRVWKYAVASLAF